MYSRNKVPLLILLFHFAICHWGAPENWPESKVLHIRQNRLILLPARSINMWDRVLRKPVAISFSFSGLRPQGLILEIRQKRSACHLLMARARLWTPPEVSRQRSRSIKEARPGECSVGTKMGTHGNFFF